LAEESGEQRGEQENARWIVDTLDGATNYTVSIALERAR
jgi:fructose-1,6-bisphosphatase/inositol monophosphatase family enzyme